MKTKILNILSIIYNIIKIEYWPYRYYILLYILFITTFTMDMITYSRIIRFMVTLIVIVIYKYLHVYINNYNIKNVNVKLLILLMYYNIIINPILYLVWNWYKYIYKIKMVLNKIIKNKKIYIFLISLIINITTPIRYVHMRYYKMLNNFQVYTIYELLLIRIYGLIISILIFSDIINYLLEVTGGIMYLMIYIYMIIYSLNVVYTYYIWGMEKVNCKTKYVKNILNIKILKYVKNMYIYIFVLKYIKAIIDQDLTLEKVYNNRVNATITGSLIKKILNSKIEDLKKQSFFELYIDKIPLMWRYYIYLLHIIGNSYMDSRFRRIIHNNNNNNNNDINSNLYYEIFLNISDIFKLLESILYYKYFNSHKIIDWKNYEDAYRLYYLILKNILHFMWSVEFYIDKNQITRLYIDNQIGEYGYSIYFNEECNDYTKISLSIKKDFINNNFLNNEKYNTIYESIYLLIKLCEKDCMYIGYKENYGLKNLNKLHLKYYKLFDISNEVDVLTIYEKEASKAYLLELNNIIQEIKQDWERLGPLDIFQNRTVFKELINHIKKDAKI